MEYPPAVAVSYVREEDGTIYVGCVMPDGHDLEVFVAGEDLLHLAVVVILALHESDLVDRARVLCRAIMGPSTTEN